MARHRSSEKGMSLLELLIATAIFMVICAAMFGLLQISQQKYAIETQMSGTFQEARLGLDQIVRDVNISGYPSLNMFSSMPLAANYAVAPIAWPQSSGYPTAAVNCQIGSCQTPTAYDLIVETDFGNGVSWIHYQLQGTTLLRGVVPKTSGSDPVVATATSVPGVMTPFVNNVMNNASSTQMAAITAQYPAMFPGGAQPIFVYTCSTPTGSETCSMAGTYNMPTNITDVDVTLIVETPYQDMQTQSIKLVELTGRGHRTNSVN